MDTALTSSRPAAALITYVWRHTRLGAMLMASADGGVCALLFADQPPQLRALLQARFPYAALTEVSPTAAQLGGWIDAVTAYLERRAALPKLPLDLELGGTAFQQQVWRSLCATKPGETITYSALAAGIGRPNAVRAAATACGANPVAVLVPCHRVVRADGGLGGYRWGLARKRALLAAERDLAKTASRSCQQQRLAMASGV